MIGNLSDPSRSRKLLLAVVLGLAVLAIGTGVVIWLNRAPAEPLGPTPALATPYRSLKIDGGTADALAFDPGGRFLIVKEPAGLLFLNLETGKERRRPLEDGKKDLVKTADKALGDAQRWHELTALLGLWMPHGPHDPLGLACATALTQARRDLLYRIVPGETTVGALTSASWSWHLLPPLRLAEQPVVLVLGFGRAESSLQILDSKTKKYRKGASRSVLGFQVLRLQPASANAEEHSGGGSMWGPVLGPLIEEHTAYSFCCSSAEGQHVLFRQHGQGLSLFPIHPGLRGEDFFVVPSPWFHLEFPLPPKQSPVALLGAGKRVVLAGEGVGVTVWDLEPARKLCALESSNLFTAFPSPVVGSGDGSRLASSIRDEIHVWDTATGKVIHRLEKSESPIKNIDCSPDGRWLLALKKDDALQLWDLESGKTVQSLKLPPQSSAVLAVSADGQLAATGTVDATGKGQTVSVWKIR